MTRSALDVLDEAAQAFKFPMLDNGYTHLAATRLSAFGDGTDWALVIEVFGYSPRNGIPDEPTVEASAVGFRPLTPPKVREPDLARGPDSAVDVASITASVSEADGRCVDQD